MRKVAVIIVSLLLCLVRSSAQDIKLKGAVVNADDGSAVSFTNIMVYCLPDSTLLGYAISSDDGTFSVAVSPSVKDLFIKVSCLGFKGQTITTTTGADSLLIRLEPDSKMLETVVVKIHHRQRESAEGHSRQTTGDGRGRERTGDGQRGISEEDSH